MGRNLACGVLCLAGMIATVKSRRTATARSVDRLIKIARTVAGLLGQDDRDAGCLLEAAGVRGVDPIAELVAEAAQLI